MKHPRDRFITVYGRKPVLEALKDPQLKVNKVRVARSAHGAIIDEILGRARRRGVDLQRVQPKEVTRLSRNKRQDQGVVADVEAMRMGALADWQPKPRSAVLVLCGLSNPQNVGMILRSATAAGLDGVILPRAGCPEVSPLVVKASAGVAFKAPILRCANLEEGYTLLAERGFTNVGLRAEGGPLWSAELPERCAFLLGNETTGVPETAPVSRWLSIPMQAGVESLNAAVAGALVAFEWARRS